MSHLQAVIYALQKIRQISRAKAEAAFQKGPRRLKEEQKLLQQELDNKTLSDEDRKQYLQKLEIIPYCDSEDDD